MTSPSLLNNLVIRDAQLEDSSELASAERTQAATPGLLASAPDELLDDAFATKIRRLNSQSNGLCLVGVAKDEGEIVGHVVLDPMPLASVSHVVHLTIVVHPGYEGKGIGRSLLQSAIERAQEEPTIEKIELRVRHTNTRAIKLYRSLDFVDEGRHVRRIKTPDGEYLDDVAMALWVG